MLDAVEHPIKMLLAGAVSLRRQPDGSQKDSRALQDDPLTGLPPRDAAAEAIARACHCRREAMAESAHRPECYSNS
jgi:hypothetical protein